MRALLKGVLVSAALAGLALPAGAAPAAKKVPDVPKDGTTIPFTTAQCFAFWKLQTKLQGEGIPALLAKGPKGPDGGLPPAEMDRVTLYLKLEERLRFRCPDFAPPPVPAKPRKR